MITSVQPLTVVGERLPNGAVLVDRAWTRSEDWTDNLVYHEAVVLCVLNHGSHRREFATWIYCLDPRQGEVTISGRYFDNIEAATADFVQRSAAQMQTGVFSPRIFMP